MLINLVATIKTVFTDDAENTTYVVSFQDSDILYILFGAGLAPIESTLGNLLKYLLATEGSRYTIEVDNDGCAVLKAFDDAGILYAHSIQCGESNDSSTVEQTIGRCCAMRLRAFAESYLSTKSVKIVRN